MNPLAKIYFFALERRSGLACLFAVIAFLTSQPAHAITTTGTLRIKSSQPLQGDHFGSVVIDANHVTLDCQGHQIHGSVHTVAGLCGTNQKCGITINGKFDIRIVRCHVIGGTYNQGIAVYNSANVTLDGSVTAGVTDAGVRVLNSSYVSIKNHASDTNYYGFYVQDSTEADTYTAGARGNVYGHYIKGGHQNSIYEGVSIDGNETGVQLISIASSKVAVLGPDLNLPPDQFAFPQVSITNSDYNGLSAAFATTNVSKLLAQNNNTMNEYYTTAGVFLHDTSATFMESTLTGNHVCDLWTDTVIPFFGDDHGVLCGPGGVWP